MDSAELGDSNNNDKSNLNESTNSSSSSSNETKVISKLSATSHMPAMTLGGYSASPELSTKKLLFTSTTAAVATTTTATTNLNKASSNNSNNININKSYLINQEYTSGLIRRKSAKQKLLKDGDDLKQNSTQSIDTYFKIVDGNNSSSKLNISSAKLSSNSKANDSSSSSSAAHINHFYYNSYQIADNNKPRIMSASLKKISNDFDVDNKNSKNNNDDDQSRSRNLFTEPSSLNNSTAFMNDSKIRQSHHSHHHHHRHHHHNNHHHHHHRHHHHHHKHKDEQDDNQLTQSHSNLNLDTDNNESSNEIILSTVEQRKNEVSKNTSSDINNKNMISNSNTPSLPTINNQVMNLLLNNNNNNNNNAQAKKTDSNLPSLNNQLVNDKPILLNGISNIKPNNSFKQIVTTNSKPDHTKSVTSLKSNIPDVYMALVKQNKRQTDEKVLEEKRKVFEDLEISTIIGTGTFGNVKLAKSKTTGEYFALKIMSISKMVQLKQNMHIRNEKNVLELVIDSPFIVKLLCTYHTTQYLYMLFEYIPGGELFSIIRNRNKLDTKAALFYAAEIVCALECLHNLQIVYRDLKPENILITREGHIKLVDFGFAKRVMSKTYTLCGTPEYIAPEVIRQKGHDLCYDWWSLGVIIYEFLTGTPPFYDTNKEMIYEKILRVKIEWPSFMDSTSRDLIKRLLNPDPTKRLGSGNCNGCVSDKTVKSLLAQKEFDSLNFESKTPKTPHLPSLNNNDTIKDKQELKNGIEPNENGFFLTEADKDDETITLHSIKNINSNSIASTTNADVRKIELISKQSTESLFNLSSLRSINNSLASHKVPPNIKYMINLGIEEVKQHKWFISISDWSDVYNLRLKPPFIPDIKHDGDTRHFDVYEPIDTSKDPVASETEINLFVDF